MSINVNKSNLIPVRRDKQITSINISIGSGAGTGGSSGGGTTYNDSSISTAISSEILSRGSADTSLSTSISSESSVRGSVDASLSTTISSVSSARVSGDASLSTGLSTETSVRISADNTFLKLSGGTMTGDVLYTTNSDLQSQTYVSGYAGSGFKLDNSSENTLEVDNLKVRNKLSAYELEINEINSVNGGLIISAANGIPYSVAGTRFYFDEDGGANQIQFAVNDYIKAQIWTGSGTGSYLGVVTNVVHSATLGNAYIDATTVSGTPWSKMKLVCVGNSGTATRQNLIYLTSSDTNAPFVDMITGSTNGVFTNRTALRIGNLTGINDAAFGGALSGYGLYADNIYLKGRIVITAGSVPNNVVTGLGSLATKSSVDLSSGDVTNKSLANVDSSANSKLSGIQAGATVGATWGSNITSQPTTLAGINSIEGTKLSGIEAGATVGATTIQVAAINTAQLLAQATNYGKMLYRDPTFISTWNSVGVYNNAGNGTVTIARTQQTDSPNYGTTGYDLTISYAGGGASPGFGGFYFGTMSRANAVLITRIVAKIPSGRQIDFHSNGYGTNSIQQWLTSQAGTGRFEEYINYVKCGDSGSFSSTNFYAISGGADSAFSWYCSFATVYDLTDTDVNYLATQTAAAATTATWSGISSKPVRFADTPSGAGLCMTASYLGYYDGGTWKSYIDNSGNCKFVGAIELGTATQSYGGDYGGTSNLALKGADIWENAVNGQSSLYINRIGYQGGTSQWRALELGDGKGGSYMRMWYNTNTQYYHGISMGSLKGQVGNEDYSDRKLRYYGQAWFYGGTYFGQDVAFGTYCNTTAEGTHTAANFILNSDAKLKTKIKFIDDKSINIDYKEFELKSEPGQKRYGVIAQDLQKSNPELVRTSSDGTLSVAYIDLLIKEIHYLKCRVNELENKIK